jgi:hypothetical protein
MRTKKYLSYDDFQTILLAPEAFVRKYPEKSALFDCHISYEAISAFIPEFSC